LFFLFCFSGFYFFLFCFCSSFPFPFAADWHRPTDMQQINIFLDNLMKTIAKYCTFVHAGGALFD
jgi:hypothetical protein